jgi:hypothetical protein
LTEIGRYYGAFNDFVIGLATFSARLREFFARTKPLPSGPVGAIMTVQ